MRLLTSGSTALVDAGDTTRDASDTSLERSREETPRDAGDVFPVRADDGAEAQHSREVSHDAADAQVLQEPSRDAEDIVQQDVEVNMNSKFGRIFIY